MKPVLTMTLVALSVALGGAAGAGQVEHVDVSDAAALIEDGSEIVVLDVRTPGEFEAIHIADAKNIDVDDDGFRANVAKLDRDKTYVVHCAAGIPGGRSERAVEIMDELGFENVQHLDGGINAWKAAGNEVVGTAASDEES